VHPTIVGESDGNDDVGRMDDMVADMGRGYDMRLKIHHRRCRISISSLLPHKKKCTMALM
jgi:hypothetical protein